MQWEKVRSHLHRFVLANLITPSFAKNPLTAWNYERQLVNPFKSLTWKVRELPTSNDMTRASPLYSFRQLLDIDPFQIYVNGVAKVGVSQHATPPSLIRVHLYYPNPMKPEH